MKTQSDYDWHEADVINGVPTAKNQEGITLGEFLEEQEQELRNFEPTKE